ncbi:hypothetical protein N7488_007988 [Penicillium malachiteum]|nr:hypothetical protein N7488_007988 [Penicillium malachiteum]
MDSPASDTYPPREKGERPIKCDVDNLKFKVFFDQHGDKLIPMKYLKAIARAALLNRQPWLFRRDEFCCDDVVEPKRSVRDMKYKVVFRALKRNLSFRKGVFHRSVEENNPIDGRITAQTGIIQRLSKEADSLLSVHRSSSNLKCVLRLDPTLASDFKHKFFVGKGVKPGWMHGPWVAGYLMLERSLCPDHDGLPADHRCPGHINVPLVPIDVTKERRLETSGAVQKRFHKKCKVLLGSVMLNLRPFSARHQEQPTQEAFLIGIHGSKLHVMRCHFRCHFPGETVSEVSSSGSTIVPPQIPLCDDADWENDTTNVDERKSSSPPAPTSASPTAQSAPLYLPGSPMPKRFFSPRLTRVLVKAARAERCPRLRVDVTREYDLWDEEDFLCAAKILAALQLYLFSGKAECAMVKKLLHTYPVDPEDEWTDLSDEDSDGDDVADYWGEKRFGCSLNEAKGKVQLSSEEDWS